MPKTTPLGVRLDEDVRKALTKAAKDDARSISSLTSKIIADWLKAAGYIDRDPVLKLDTNTGLSKLVESSMPKAKNKPKAKPR